MHRFLKKHFILPHDETDRTPVVDLLRNEMVSAGFIPMDIPFNILKRDCNVIRESGYDITAVLLWDGQAFRLCRIEAGDTSSQMYGFAVDLGSTTVVARLIDLNTGKVICEKSSRNHQRKHGDDILSRIFYSHNDPDKLQEIQMLTADSINSVCLAACETAGILYESICFMAVAGNTTMTHFLLGLDAFCVFQSPFRPTVSIINWITAADLNLNFSGFVYCFPAAANYLGGDIISGILSCNMHKTDKLSLFIDIGTNGEMVIGSSEYLIGGAGAAGPALEAGISKSGMRAKEGAIESIRISDGHLTYSVIGGGKPIGICGSGIVDLLAQMLLSGWIDRRGRLQPDASDRIIRVDISEDGEPRSMLAVVYTPAAESASGEDLYFTQKDITDFTASKAAAHTMVASLLRESGLSIHDIDTIYLAGAFGKHMDRESAITIGMYPDIPRERFVPVGNSSLQGAEDFLLGRFSADDANEIAERIYFLEFAMQDDFLNMMRAASFYPHTDLDSYPSVAKRLLKLTDGLKK